MSSPAIPFTPGEILAVNIVNGVSTLLSFFGEAFMIYSYYKYNESKNFSMRLVIALIYADVVFSISNAMLYVESTNLLCSIQGFLRLWSFLSSIIWGIYILKAADIITSREKGQISFKKLIIWNLMISAVPPMFSLISQLVGGPAYFSDDLIYCSVGPDEEAIFIFLIPATVGIVIALWITMKMICGMKRNSDNSYLLKYVIVMIIMVIPNIIEKFIYLVDENFPILIIQVFFSRIAGFLNAVIYGLHRFRSETRYMTNEIRTSNELEIGPKKSSENLLLIDEQMKREEVRRTLLESVLRPSFY